MRWLDKVLSIAALVDCDSYRFRLDRVLDCVEAWCTDGDADAVHKQFPNKSAHHIAEELGRACTALEGAINARMAAAVHLQGDDYVHAVRAFGLVEDVWALEPVQAWFSRRAAQLR